MFNVTGEENKLFPESEEIQGDKIQENFSQVCVCVSLSVQNNQTPLTCSVVFPHSGHDFYFLVSSS